ncbi:efflux RND transporter periplasmic adaptor subunit [Methylobacterium durans]|uniref:CusB-like beta-barrel domain-containing protein n=1 Tax=Methylobacterium durans TaxID=2202825 RepID=A0A2U8W8X1_9HYPH|nr:efflux RND transporter periplasmic adaptor subunit [Methylobacterium durans]AWN41762.1 hypothetical protein DK389_16205 [Methylobacterium durans]
MRPFLVWAALLLGLCPALAGPEKACLLTPKTTVELGAASDGLLDAMLVERGEIIKAGQTVARIRSWLEEAALVSAEARAGFDGTVEKRRAELDALQDKLDRKKGLAEKGVMAAEAYADLLVQTRVAEQALREARFDRTFAALEARRAGEAVRNKLVVSPVDGVVLQKLRSAGEFISAQAPAVLRVAQLDPLHVEVAMPLEAFGTIALGTPVLVRVEALPLEHLSAKVVIIDPAIDAASKTFGVRLELPNPGNRIPSGLRCQIDWQPNS